MLSPQDRRIRVFVSSTFRDMHAEREHLVKFVFPELRRLCQSHGVEWAEVDLRWGITQSEAERGEVVELCLEEIDRCRPYFIGLLGDHYGTAAGQVAPNLQPKEGWPDDYRERSVTELEIIHGVLSWPAPCAAAFFYFRQPAAGKSGMPAAGESIVPAVGRTRLAALKESIRRHHCVGFLTHAPREHYTSAEVLGRAIRRDFSRLIRALYPKGAKPRWHEAEAMAHEAFARSKAAVFVGREKEFARLDCHVANDGSVPLVVLGETGVGKSALLANWVLHYREKMPGDLSLIHFVGCTGTSSDPTRVVRRILSELQAHWPALLDQPVPDTPDSVRDAFPEWLARVAAADPEKKAVLVVDGLNQLDDRERGLDLGWLPRSFPTNVRVIVSTLPGRCLDATRDRGWPELVIPPMRERDRLKLLWRFLARHGKRLGKASRRRIIGAEQTANPLFLRALLDELRQFGDYEQLGERIDHYLGAKDAVDLYIRILGRWEEDYGNTMVRDCFGLLLAARRGLSESELLDLLGAGGAPLPRARWTPFFLAAESAFIHRAGLLGFNHSCVAAAASQRYGASVLTRQPEFDENPNPHEAALPSEESPADLTVWHQALARYFAHASGDFARKLDEFPWQLQRARNYEALHGFVSSIPVFRELVWSCSADLLDYWKSLNRNGFPDIAGPYRNSLATWEFDDPAPSVMERSAALDQVGKFLHELCGQHSEAEPFIRRAIELVRNEVDPDDPSLLASMNNLAALLDSTGRYDEASAFYREVLERRRLRLGDMARDTLLSLNNLAQNRQKAGDLEEAERLLREATAGPESQLSASDPLRWILMSNLGNLLDARGEHLPALDIITRAVQGLRDACGPEDPRTLKLDGNRAELLRRMHRHQEAAQAHAELLKRQERVLGPEHPDTLMTVNNLGVALGALNKYVEEERLHRRALSGRERILGTNHHDTLASLANLGSNLRKQKRYAEAEPLLIRAFEQRKTALGESHPETLSSLHNLAHLRFDQERLVEAEQQFRLARDGRAATLGPAHLDTLASAGNLACVLENLAREFEAESLFKEILSLKRNCLGDRNLSTLTTMGNLARLYRRQKRYQDALPLLRELIAGYTEAWGAEHEVTKYLVELLREGEMRTR